MNLFREYRQEWGAIILYECGIVSQLAFLLSKFYNVPIFFWLGGSSKSVRMNLRFTDSFKGILKMMMTWENDIALKIMSHWANGLLLTGIGLKEQFPGLETKLYHFIATGIRFDQIEPELPSQRLKKVNNLFQIISVCNVVPTKGLEFAIKALPYLLQRGINVNYKIVGPHHDITYLTMLNKLIKEEKMENIVSIPGPIRHGSDLFTLYREADVFVLPSLSEGTPKVLPEAMCKGLPMVVTNVGALPEIISDGIHGYVVAAGNTAALAGALIKLAGDAELRFRMGEEAVKRVADYTLERQMAGVANWINSKIGES